MFTAGHQPPATSLTRPGGSLLQGRAQREPRAVLQSCRRRCYPALSAEEALCLVGSVSAAFYPRANHGAISGRSDPAAVCW